VGSGCAALRGGVHLLAVPVLRRQGAWGVSFTPCGLARSCCSHSRCWSTAHGPRYCSASTIGLPLDIWP
jgi:hypothetical protein